MRVIRSWEGGFVKSVERLAVESSGGGCTPEDFKWGAAVEWVRNPYSLSFGFHLDWRTRELALFLGTVFLNLGRIAYKPWSRFSVRITTMAPGQCERWNVRNRGRAERDALCLGELSVPFGVKQICRRAHGHEPPHRSDSDAEWWAPHDEAGHER